MGKYINESGSEHMTFCFRLSFLRMIVITEKGCGYGVEVLKERTTRGILVVFSFRIGFGRRVSSL